MALSSEYTVQLLLAKTNSPHSHLLQMISEEFLKTGKLFKSCSLKVPDISPVDWTIVSAQI